VSIQSNLDPRFLLAQLHMNNLINLPTKGHIKQALQNLAKGIEGLDNIYEQAIKRIEDQRSSSRELAKQILTWIVHAKRPLSTAELRYALAVKPYTVKLDEDYLPGVRILRSVCAGLVTVDEESDIVRLVHYTTQEYFERTWTSWFPDTQRYIATTCVTYLTFDAFAAGFCPTDEEFETRLQLNPLYDYAARNWGHHARATSAVEQLVVDFLKSEAKVSSSGQAMMASRSYSGYSQRVPRQMTGLHVAAYFGLAAAIMALFESGLGPDVKDTYGKTPLSRAAGNGHEAVVKLLLAKDGVELNSEDEFHQTPLSHAAENGHEAVVKLLLAKDGVELNSKDEFHQTPLSHAAGNGHEAAVKLLLAKDGVELNSKDDNNQTPLSRAAGNGHEAVVKLLLAKDGVELNSKDEFHQTPLSHAAGNGHEAVVKLLSSIT